MLRTSNILLSFKTGDPVSIHKSSFSLNEFWSNIHPNENDSRHDEGYLELQWTLPMGMSLEEKFVLRFEQVPLKNSTNQARDVFKVSSVYDSDCNCGVLAKKTRKGNNI